MHLPIGQLYRINGRMYRLAKSEMPTAEQLSVLKERQATCLHDGAVHYTDPLTCALCGAEMPKRDSLT